MKILNLYSGIGGNRKLWGNQHEITAVEYREDIAQVYKDNFPFDDLIIDDAHEYLLENYKKFDFIWSSPPCQSHSRARFWGFKNNNKVKKQYPSMSIYQEIIFLKHYYTGKWVVENVNPFYDPLINPSVKIGRHLFWSNFLINKIKVKEADINKGTIKHYKDIHGFDLKNYKFKTRKDQIYRNCVAPQLGLHILNNALNQTQLKL